MRDRAMKAPRAVNHIVTRRLLSFARPHAWRLVLAGLCLLLSSAATLAFPYVIGLLVDSVFVRADPALLNRAAFVLLGAVFVTAVFGYGRGHLLSYVGNRIVSDLRVRLYAHLQRLSLSFYDERRTGEIMSRLTSDTTLVQEVVTNNLLSMMQQVVTFLAVVTIVLATDWRLALVAIAVAPLVVLAALLVGRPTRTFSERMQEELGAANTVLEETLSSMRIVKAFGREDHEVRRYSDALWRAFGVAVTSARLRALFEAVVTAMGFVAIVAVLWFGGHEVLNQRLSPGELVSFLLYLMLLVGPIQSLSTLYYEFQQALGAAKRVFDLLDEVPTVVDKPSASYLPPVRGHLAVRGAHFSYDDKQNHEVLRGVDFEVEAGQTAALVGPSGAGKTTLTSLLLRFYDPTAGCILVDGHDIADVTLESLRATMGIVPQEPTLFGGTIRDNIAYGRIEAAEPEIVEAARAANAHDFIITLPQGYDTLVGERGVRLSGGQRQRIAIARAVLKDPRLLILDEATSSLDNESESLVQEALEHLMAGRTTLVIAHRLTTVERADKIIVVDAGRVVEKGTHDELLMLDGLYHRLYARDFVQERDEDATYRSTERQEIK